MSLYRNAPNAQNFKQMTSMTSVLAFTGTMPFLSVDKKTEVT